MLKDPAPRRGTYSCVSAGPRPDGKAHPFPVVSVDPGTL
ncbi:hypothetical protein SAMN05421688_0280 [Poseidonocella pacifica]|uniref:Uncharacterized protein n=1 Tax=Poseidonocella pacifica TaxID=871651 RepID=A0A1I0V461_9RHOB|nr:hypothetical protein SAMN05421688_0280 [Poseidonocella pacifica]